MREHLNTEQAAEYLGVSESWLAGSRVRGDGPPFYRLGGAVRYIRSALDAWASKRHVVSTAQRQELSE